MSEEGVKQQVSSIAWRALWFCWKSENVKGSMSLTAADRIQSVFESAMLPAEGRNPMTGAVITLENTGPGYEEFKFKDGGFFAFNQEDAGVLRKRFDGVVDGGTGYPVHLARGFKQADELLSKWQAGHGERAKPE